MFNLRDWEIHRRVAIVVEVFGRFGRCVCVYLDELKHIRKLGGEEKE